MNSAFKPALCAFGAVLLAHAVADAHVSVASGPAAANTSQEITFGVGHGCDQSDTYQVTVDIPAGVTSVRGMSSDFGAVSYTKDNAGNVTSVTWKKPDASLYPSDSQYYKLTLRARTPNAPFTKLLLVTHQTCKDTNGVLTTVDWSLPPDSDAGGEPAPILYLLPAKSPGWNKWTVPVAVSTKDLKELFRDAHIVWRGTAAYSSNAATLAQIKSEQGVTELTDLKANDEIWVRY